MKFSVYLYMRMPLVMYDEYYVYVTNYNFSGQEHFDWVEVLNYFLFFMAISYIEIVT